jgi:three-Cys-motif partner protein
LVQFHGDAIVLSGTTGTKLKCDILAGYYRTWWGITSGGSSHNNPLATAIVELNAGSGEDYIEEVDETIPGSSGHALKLKMETPNTTNLKIVLVEEDEGCYNHLRSVIRRRWPTIDLAQAEGPPNSNQTGIYLLHKNPSEALDAIEKLWLRNVIFFFDPLLFTPWAEIDRVAKRRMLGYYQTGTEFIVFLFTSDWFKGRRRLEIVPLPQSGIEAKWSDDERKTVAKLDELFGDSDWRRHILVSESDEVRMDMLVQLYRKRLHKWFRYVRPMPFKPKEGQTYHLFMCTNYERGIGITSSFYNKFTNNKSQRRALDDAYARFARLHPETLEELEGNQKPATWRFLVEITRDHDEGLCDERCADLGHVEPDPNGRKECLQWLAAKGYLDAIPPMTDAWSSRPQLYKLNWEKVSANLGLLPPQTLHSMEPRAS